MIMLSYNVGLMVVDTESATGDRVAQSIPPLLSSPKTMDLSEEKQLVTDAKSNTESFGKLYDFYFPKVYAFVATKVNERDDAEDLVSDIFMKVLENIHKFEWRGVPFGAWIFRIARNVLNDYYHQHNKTKTSDIEEAYGVSEPEEKVSPHLNAAREELSEAVKKAIKTLPERELLVIQLKFFSELSNREIVQVTGLTESNVAIILYRTLRKIKPDLQYFA